MNAGQAAEFANGGSAGVIVTAGAITPSSWTFDSNSQSYTVNGQAVNFSGAGGGVFNNASAGQAISIFNNMTGANLNQSAASTLTILSADSFTTTTISAGTLVNGNSLTSAVGVTGTGTFTNDNLLTGTVNNAATLGNFGTITGLVTNSGTATNGNSLNGGLSNTAGTFANNFRINNGATVTGGTLNSNTATSVINGGLTNSATVNAENQVNGVILNQSSGVFNVTGALTGNDTFTNNGTAQLNVTAGNFAGITTLTNSSTNANGIVIAAGDTLNATGISNSAGASIQNSGTMTATAGPVTNSGTLNNLLSTSVINGGLTSSAGTTTNNGTINGAVNITGGILTGTGTLSGAATIGSGATFTPGNGSPGSSMTVNSLTMSTGSTWQVNLSPTTSSLVNVVNTADLTHNYTINAVFAPGSYLSHTYTLLTAANIVGSASSALLITPGKSSNIDVTLLFDATAVELITSLNFVPPTGSSFSQNQQNVATAILKFFNAGGSIPMTFGSLTPAGLAQLSGETATGSQQTTFDAMGQFMGLMTDPFMAGRGDASSGGGATGYTDEAVAYAKRNPNDALAAIYTKVPPRAVPFEARWSTWIAGYGGSQTTDGNAAVGSSSTTSRVYGTAVGADYRFSPFTTAGFSLAGGGTNFIVNGFGSGRSDLFQAGAYIRHEQGAAYVTAALAYGWQDITTNRTVNAAGFDQLQARFNANAYSGRVESGYRFVAPWIGGVGVTPYAAGQFTTFVLPAYAETALSGADTSTLSYASQRVTDGRSELGLRTDKSFAMQDAILTLRGRAAWAHDFNPNRVAGATFQALPGASFVVNGAAQASDSALTTASAEIKWSNRWSVAATFEGEFSDVTRSYAGKGVLRYQW